jgi:hypothetical protein
MKLKPNDFRKIVVGSFLAVPALSSLISTIHIVTFFGLGNMPWMAIILALAFEIGSIASLMTLAVLDKVNRFAVWFIFFVLVAMQMLGNVYYTYDFISQSMLSNPQWITSFIDLVEMMTMQKLDPRMSKFILSLLIGLPIPVISLAFLKSVSDYLKPEEKQKEEESKKEETKESTEEVKEESDSIEEASDKDTTEEESSETEEDKSENPIIHIGGFIVKPRVEEVVEGPEKIEEKPEEISHIEEKSIESEIVEGDIEIIKEELEGIPQVEEENTESIKSEVDVEIIEKEDEKSEENENYDSTEEIAPEESLKEEENLDLISSEQNENIYEEEVISVEERIIEDIIEEQETEIKEDFDSENDSDEKKN